MKECNAKKYTIQSICDQICYILLYTSNRLDLKCMEGVELCVSDFVFRSIFF